jgi:hypothetical protein
MTTSFPRAVRIHRFAEETIRSPLQANGSMALRPCSRRYSRAADWGRIIPAKGSWAASRFQYAAEAILRHANVSMTQRCYIKTLPKQTIDAMNRLNELVCADCAPSETTTSPELLN